MDLLLDTHAFLWWDTRSPRLGSIARAAIGNPDNRIVVSAASVWEIAIKRRLGKLPFQGGVLEKVERNKFEHLAMSARHAEHAAALPLLHADPFDRMLVAQARLENLVVVTGDGLVAQYDVPVMPIQGSEGPQRQP